MHLCVKKACSMQKKKEIKPKQEFMSVYRQRNAEKTTNKQTKNEREKKIIENENKNEVTSLLRY